MRTDQQSGQATAMRENTRRNGKLATIGIVAALAVAACVPATQEEVAMGNDYAQQVERGLPMIRDPDIVRYINVLGDSIARVSDDRELLWRFNVVDQPEINAFAVPGGHIYVYRGLIEKTTSMSELAGVLGHEIAHVTQRHSMQQMAKAQRANLGLTGLCIFVPSACQGVAGTVMQIGAQAGFAKFSRDDEASADTFGVTYVTRAGIDPRGMPSMFRILIAERERNPSGVDAFFASHPIEESRVANTEAEIRKIDPVVLKSLTRDTRAFQTFKTRLAGLPRTPATR
jgi:predicted Zn-dependent protease